MEFGVLVSATDPVMAGTVIYSDVFGIPLRVTTRSRGLAFVQPTQDLARGHDFRELPVEVDGRDTRQLVGRHHVA